MTLALAAAVLLLQGATGQGSAGQTAGEAPVRLGVSIEPDTVTVGDPFRVTVRVRAARGATIQFPEAPDSGAAVEALDPPVIRRVADSSAVEQIATYRLVAWDTGPQPLALGDVVVDLGAETRRAPLDAYNVVVRSVLPADSAQRVPKPARPLFERPIPWWVWALLALAALALVGVLVWWWRRRRRRAAGTPALDPYEQAQREFARVEALGLAEAGERGRYVALMVDVLRDYLAARRAPARLSLTSHEVLAALRGEREGVVPVDRLRPLLEEADLVKFARQPLTYDHAREMGREARALVADIEGAEERARAVRDAAVPEGRAA